MRLFCAPPASALTLFLFFSLFVFFAVGFVLGSRPCWSCPLCACPTLQVPHRASLLLPRALVTHALLRERATGLRCRPLRSDHHSLCICSFSMETCIAFKHSTRLLLLYPHLSCRYNLHLVNQDIVRVAGDTVKYPQPAAKKTAIPDR